MTPQASICCRGARHGLLAMALRDGAGACCAGWVIERTFAWLSRNRRLAKDFERLINTSTAMAVLAIIQMLMRRLASP